MMAGLRSVTASWRFGVLVLLGWLSLAAPTLWDFLFGTWSAYSQGHEMLLLIVMVWLLVRQGVCRISEPPVLPSVPVWAWLGFALGLAAYVFGRTQEFIRVEILALWWISQMVLVLVAGVAAWRRSWFVWLFALFLVPVPFSLVLMLTAPLKEAVSAVATWLLGALGYPIARTGVVITVGQYQLLVAEACAGLHSMFILEAMGLLYSHLVDHRSVWRNGLLALFAVPVSFAANVVRVCILVVVTYHWGDATGQGFVHHFAGLVLFAAALCLMAVVDAFLGLFWPDAPGAHRPEGQTS